MKYLLLLLFGCFAHAQSSELVLKPTLERVRAKNLKSFPVEGSIPEGSGLAAWDGKLWTHNDSGRGQLFALDTATGKIVETYDLPLKNRDWEEIAQDEDYFYLGNFGNNNHNSDVLQIFRINKQSLLQHDPSIETITFTWPETVTDGKQRKTNFDCEAMVVKGDSICLFTKEWQEGHRTRLFTLPTTPGTWIARYRQTLKTRILVTGASFDQTTNQLVLCGYNMTLRPFLLVFPETNGTDFFSKRGKKIRIRRRFRQVEGVATFDGIHYYLISEDFRRFLLHTRQELLRVRL